MNGPLEEIRAVADDMERIRHASPIDRYKWSWNMWDEIDAWRGRIERALIRLERRGEDK